MWRILRYVCERVLVAIERLGVLRLVLSMQNKTIVLAYHGVGDIRGRVRNSDGKHVAVAAFAGQMAHLRRNYKLLNPEDVCRNPQGSGVVVTFDDGYENVLVNAVPVLQRSRIRAVMFLPMLYVHSSARRKVILSSPICTPAQLLDFAEHQLLHWHDVLELLFEHLEGNYVALSCGSFSLSSNSARRESFLRLKELLKSNPAIRYNVLGEIAKNVLPRMIGDVQDYLIVSQQKLREYSDVMMFGSHALSHDVLTVVADPLQEITESKRLLENLSGQTVSMFAYPNGVWNYRIKDMVRSAGYACAMTTQSGRVLSGNYFCIPRVVITGNDSYLRFVWKLLHA